MTKIYETPHHLSCEERINLGSYYTSSYFVELVWNFISKYFNYNPVIFDPACGYGNFLFNRYQRNIKLIGNDIDSDAIIFAKKNIKDCIFYNENSLHKPTRQKFGIDNDDFLIIIGNPPYNDTTSQIKNKIKKIGFDIDHELKARDIGISFLRMFEKLNPNIISVLHPLSYLIKKANFNLLKNFTKNYKLVDGLIISSSNFINTSKTTAFPILISHYIRDEKGMDYDYIKSFKFTTIDAKKFSLNDFDYIGNYINKYPKKNTVINEDDLLFYTMRDINALKRNKTFIKKKTLNSIKIDIKLLDYYIYVDVFKDFTKKIPYYLGNLDIIIDDNLFQKFKKYFISYAIKKNKNYIDLEKYYSKNELYKNDAQEITKYFKILLGEHYED